jgi:hypothetical protein
VTRDDTNAAPFLISTQLKYKYALLYLSDLVESWRFHNRAGTFLHFLFYVLSIRLSATIMTLVATFDRCGMPSVKDISCAWQAEGSGSKSVTVERMCEKKRRGSTEQRSLVEPEGSCFWQRTML